MARAASSYQSAAAAAAAAAASAAAAAARSAFRRYTEEQHEGPHEPGCKRRLPDSHATRDSKHQCVEGHLEHTTAAAAADRGPVSGMPLTEGEAVTEGEVVRQAERGGYGAVSGSGLEALREQVWQGPRGRYTHISRSCTVFVPAGAEVAEARLLAARRERDERLQAESEVAHVVGWLVTGVERAQKAAAAAAVRRKEAQSMGSEQREAAARVEAAAQVVEWLVQSVAEQAEALAAADREGLTLTRSHGRSGFLGVHLRDGQTQRVGWLKRDGLEECATAPSQRPTPALAQALTPALTPAPAPALTSAPTLAPTAAPSPVPPLAPTQSAVRLRNAEGVAHCLAPPHASCTLEPVRHVPQAGRDTAAAIQGVGHGRGLVRAEG